MTTLGVVSGGRGRLGNCGGINNPTHYGRSGLHKFIEKCMVYCQGFLLELTIEPSCLCVGWLVG